MGDRGGGEKSLDTTLEFVSRSADLERRVMLIVHHALGTETLPLAPNQPLTVGRHQSVNFTIPDPSLSRVHARLELRGREVWLEDLNSRNGSLVNGDVVGGPRVISPGDEVRLGAVVIEVHVREGSLGRALGLEPYEAFLRAVGQELPKAREAGRTLALLMVWAADPGRCGLKEWYEIFRRDLRGIDRATAYGGSEVLLLSSEPSIEETVRLVERIVRADRSGAKLRASVVLFPKDANSLDELIERAREAGIVAAEERPVVRAEGTDRSSAAVVAPEPARGPMAQVLLLAAKVAKARLPVLIRGETGVGKEVLAQRIHRSSGRAKGPLRSINCGSIPRQLIESTLFGHEKGAFTGAEKARRGLFEEAQGGTVFLDEVGELSAEAQVALLRVIEEQRVTRVGSSEEIPVDVRVVAATHRDLEGMVRTGGLREDLYYRLNAVTIEIPPLRERKDEIVPLAMAFLSRARQTHGARPTGISPEALELLQRYQWPGNIRELRNVIDRASVIADGDQITSADLPDSVLGSRIEAHPELPVEAANDQTLRLRLQSYERKVVLDALEATGWNMSQAAKDLGIPYRTFTGKLRLLGIQRPKGQ